MQATGTPRIVNNTIADNEVTSPIFRSALLIGRGPALVANNIIAAPQGQVAVICRTFGLGRPSFRSNNVFGAFGGGDCLDPIGADGNISADPLFVDPSLSNYRLKQDSPALDAGDDGIAALLETDLDGLPRIVDGDGDAQPRVDMGAFERHPQRCSVELAYEAGTLTLDLELYTAEPTLWRGFLAYSDKVGEWWSRAIPTVAPPATYEVPIPGFPSIGYIAVVSVFQQGEDVSCVDHDIVDTGGPGPAAREMRFLLERLAPTAPTKHTE
jgi:hypothetical protein